ncbi:MAG: undecaprenyl-diphosphate phosphatase [Pirellulaceae bacterium]
MSDVVSAALQGIVEGLTEFLPISSTAHIVFTQKLLAIDNTLPFWKMFTVFIQLGAILSVVVYFWKRLCGFVGSFLSAPQAVDGQPTVSRFKHPLSLVLVSFVVTAVPCFLIDKFIGENLERIDFMAIALIVGGVAMYVIDRACSKRASTQTIEAMTMWQAITIGLAQILAAAFPGTSRSMATIAGGQLMGLSRSAALEFSFFLSIPVMVAASSFKLVQHLAREPLPSTDEWLALGVGFISSFIVAYAVIAWFMHWVRKHGFTPFAIYRVACGAVVLWWMRS